MITNKKGMELAISYLVLLILVILSMAATLTFFARNIGLSEELVAKVDAEAENQLIKRMTASSARFVIPEFTISASPQESTSFIIGIRNAFDTHQTFTVHTSIKKITDEEGNPAPQDMYDGSDTWLFETLGPYQLDPDEIRIIPVPVRINNGKLRLYTVHVEIEIRCDRSSDVCAPYDSRKSIEVKVVG